MENVQKEATESEAKARVIALRYVVVAALLAALCFEGYYIFLLRATIKKQAEDLSNSSVQLQLLKSERKILSEELLSARKQAGENNDGNTTQR